MGGAQTTGSGTSFWDIGTLAARLEAGIGTRVLSAVDASLVWLNPSLLTFGDLNLLGLTNPLGSVPPKSLMYGAVADWTTDPSIAWGTPIQDPQGQGITWGTGTRRDGLGYGERGHYLGYGHHDVPGSAVTS